MNPAPLILPHSERRLAGMAATVLAHAALILAWQAARQADRPAEDTPSSFIQWIEVPKQAPAAPAPDRFPNEAPRASAAGAMRPHLPERPRPSPAADPVPASEPAATPGPAPAADGLSAPANAVPSVNAHDSARQMLEHARREAGAIERALRKERNPVIVLPPDSPQIRMKKKFAEAAALAPNRLWEAPKMEELVNDTGDGARRTRVVTPGGNYCLTERSPVTSIDTIEKHGKIRFTNCGSGHEQPANPQEWRTARD